MADEEKKLDVSAHPGAILRAAREEVPLSIEQVASSLHLRSTVVLSMERDLYDDFDSDVFLKGYFRSYCRLVGLHEERMVGLLDQRLLKLKEGRQKEKELAEKARLHKTRKKLFQQAGLAIGLLCFGAASVFYLLKTDVKEITPLGASRAAQPTVQTEAALRPAESLDDSQIETPVEEIEEQSLANMRAEDIFTPAPEKLTEGSERQNIKPDNERLIEGDDVSVETSVNGDSSDSVSDESDRSSEPYSLEPQSGIAELKSERDAELQVREPLSVLTDESAQVTERTADSALSALVITFEDDCWFQLVNGEQRTPIARLQRAGDRVVYNGPRPYRVVLGNARVAKVSYLGSQYDLSSVTRRNGRAEFVLD